jgi:hypothetical protein
MGNHRPILSVKGQQKLILLDDIVLKRQRCISAVIKKQKVFIRWQKLPYTYNKWLGNRSLKATYSQIF